MQTEPPKADAPKRKRRWFQFSLRTMMIVVTLLAIYFGSISWLIHEREQLSHDRDAWREQAEEAQRRIRYLSQTAVDALEAASAAEFRLKQALSGKGTADNANRDPEKK
jgi:hypothetical protein